MGPEKASGTLAYGIKFGGALKLKRAVHRIQLMCFNAIIVTSLKKNFKIIIFIACLLFMITLNKCILNITAKLKLISFYSKENLERLELQCSANTALKISGACNSEVFKLQVIIHFKL